MRKAALLVVVLLRPAGVWAHVFPLRSDPRVGSTVRAAPGQVAILFDGPMKPSVSVIRVETMEKVAIDRQDSHVDPKNPNQLIVTLPPEVSPGQYRVRWEAVCRDGHATAGEFLFRVAGHSPP